MKQFLSYMIVALAALWMAGCSDDSLSPADQPERGIVIRLSTGDLETRTDLTSQANLQHVRKVYALLYDGTGTLVDSPELLMDVASQAWDPTEGGSYNDINGEEFVLPQTKTAGLEAGDYTVLCVGLDDRSGETYGLTLDKMKTWTLKEARATLAAGKGVDDIAHSELFAGWAEFDFEPDNINIVEVEMKRRVAGVLCYVTDIPTTINTSGANKNKPVTKLRLALYTGEKPNNSIALPRLEVTQDADGQTDIPRDFGTYDPAGSNLLSADEDGYLTLAEVDLKEEGFTADEEIFTRPAVPVAEGNPVAIKKNALLLGAYVLPTAGAAPAATLKVELLGEGDEVLATFNAKRDGTSGNESYNIYPNYIYHIGDKPESDSTEGDQPASLLGKELTVDPQPWDEELLVDVEFPSVPLINGMELVNQDYSAYSKNYTFDCIGIDDDNNGKYNTARCVDRPPYNERLFVKVKASIMKNSWKLEIVDTEDWSMLYISQKVGDSYSYTTSYIGNGQADEYVPLLLTSFASNDGSKTRSVTLKLTTLDDKCQPTDNVDSLTVTQNNALIVYDDEGNPYRGASRKDWDNGRAIAWGYDGINNNAVFGDATYNRDSNGQENVNVAGFRNHDGYFYTSAMYYCARKFVTVKKNETTGELEKDTPKDWYLPARKELQHFLSQYGNAGSGTYWSATPYGPQRTYYNYVESDGSLFDESSFLYIQYADSKEEEYKMRPMCNL